MHSLVTNPQSCNIITYVYSHKNYGTHQLQLKCDMHIILCLVSTEPRTREKSHNLCVHVHMFLYTRT